MIDHWRREEIERAYLETIAHLPEAETPSAKARALVLELLESIARVLEDLKPTVRQAFLLAQCEGFTHKQIAAQLGLSLRSVECYVAAELNTVSAADLDYTVQQRLIKLTRGEIIVTCGGIDEGSSFDRPLRVKSRHGVYEGIGARFILRQDADCTRLSVSCGIVAIHSPLAADGVPIRVEAGQSYLIDHNQAQLAPPLSMDAGAWVDGLIVTRDMHLGDFLIEVARYRHGFLTYSADIADLCLSGGFRLENTDKLLASLPETLPVQLRYRSYTSKNPLHCTAEPGVLLHAVRTALFSTALCVGLFSCASLNFCYMGEERNVCATVADQF